MQRLDTIAQYAMDLYYQNFKGNDDFFDLPDFVFHSGSAVAELYLNFFREQYAIARQEKSEEVVSFPTEWLLIQTVPVKDGVATIDFGYMSFPYDRQSAGIQHITDKNGCILERSGLQETWQSAYLPETNRLFWHSVGNKIFFTKRVTMPNEVDIYYIPSISDEMEVPDGIISTVVNQVAVNMRKIAQGVIVDETPDSNPNKTIQTEANKNSLLN